jgi:hypothetical protein
MKHRIYTTPLVVAVILTALYSGVGAANASNSGSESDESSTSAVQDGRGGQNRSPRPGKDSQNSDSSSLSTTLPGSESQREDNPSRRRGADRTAQTPPPQPRTPERAAAIAEWRIQIEVYRDARMALVDARNLAVSTARTTFVEARNAADTKELRRTAHEALKVAISQAQSEYKAGMKELGKPPMRPRLETGTTTTTTTTPTTTAAG